MLRDPGGKVPVLLVEVDRENEGTGTLVAKLVTYRAWCQLPAKGTTKRTFEASLRRNRARTHELRLWSVLYLPTGRVVEAGRKRARRPGTPPPTPEEKREKAKRDHQRLLRRIHDVEAASEPTWYAPPYRTEGITARDHHRALPVVATTLPLLRRRGAGAAIWRRFGRPGWDALDNPDGDRLRHTGQAREREREEAERERRRPTCTRCKAKFSNERWSEHERAGTWGDDGLCAGCRRPAGVGGGRARAGRSRSRRCGRRGEARRLLVAPLVTGPYQRVASASGWESHRLTVSLSRSGLSAGPFTTGGMMRSSWVQPPSACRAGFMQWERRCGRTGHRQDHCGARRRVEATASCSAAARGGRCAQWTWTIRTVPWSAMPSQASRLTTAPYRWTGTALRSVFAAGESTSRCTSWL
ncbi:hypothetical protein [Kitasatospora sp. NPDC050543]|uniref:hypothetical protein n=1 Tax=Kitasatospora sp. NPDC050543 TaxID=3364054 RepID=UPI00378E03CF